MRPISLVKVTIRIMFSIGRVLEKDDGMLESLDGIQVVADDVLVYGRGKDKQTALENHNRILERLLERCNLKNLKINKDKMRLE